MNLFHFTGRLAKAPTMAGNGDKAVVKFTLIQDEYAGKDEETGESKERQVSAQFTAFGPIGEIIAKHSRKGDQLILTTKLRNNFYTDKNNEPRFEHEFIVKEFDFGAPGPEKRSELASRQRAVTAARESAPA